ncbi:MAG: helix-turn-helix domain-containing protein, partial [Thermomicrobiales bacterium]
MAETATRTEADATADAANGGLALWQRAAGPALRGLVRDYWGYSEQTAGPVRRRELPSADIIFIVNVGAPLLVRQPRAEFHVIPGGGGFVAGLHETYALTETAGSQSGIELRMSPLGAYRLVGEPMETLVNRSVPIDELFGSWAIELGERLHDAPGWEARFATLDHMVGTRLADAAPPSPEVVWAWRQLARSGGRISIAMLAEELGWSPKRLIARFREQVGLPPKQVARLLRFQRATHLL